MKSPWHSPLMDAPLPTFPCQERSNYTEISTEKDRLLLWHQRQGSCKSGAATAAASGHCGDSEGALTSSPPLPLGHYPVQNLTTLLGAHLNKGQGVKMKDVVNRKTRNRCSINY